MTGLTRFVRIGTSMAVVGGATVVLWWFGVNSITVVLSYVIVILSLAIGWGIAEATIASIVAMICFNFFFLPPAGTLTIADPQNWIAFVAFLVTAVVVSQLSGRARQRTIDALDRQRDLERLYALSRSLLIAEQADGPVSPVAQRIAEMFDLSAVAVYDARTDTVSRGGGDIDNVDARLREVARQAVTVRDTTGTTVVAIRLGGAPIGSLAVGGASLSDTVLQSIANLVAIAFERDRGRQVTLRAEAARQSGELRATVLDAIAHEFKTPLTSLKMAASELQSEAERSSRDRELLLIVQEDIMRLQALVTDAVQMLRIDAGDFVVRRGRYRLAGIVAATLLQEQRRLDGRNVVNRVSDTIEVMADADLIGLALRQLVDNAIKYSPPAAAIEIDASRNGVVALAVRNAGPVISAGEVGRLFERFYRGSGAGQVPGTGIGLSIVKAIAEAHGGTLTVDSEASRGTTFTLSIPAEPGA